jgi:hypothetical protein
MISTLATPQKWEKEEEAVGVDICYFAYCAKEGTLRKKSKQ